MMKQLMKSLSAWILIVSTAQAAEFASVFSDHMVLQQGMPVPIWGTGIAGESIGVAFAGQKKSTKSDDKGNWMLRLDTLKASSEPGILTLHSADGVKTISDVLVGEVWIASGQSNMALQVAFSAGSGEEKAPDPMIRLLAVPLAPSATPKDVVNAKWQLAEGKPLGSFSAVGYFFAKHLSATRKVPIGIINSSVGGTPARAWTPREVMSGDPRLKHQTDRIDAEMKKYDPAVAEAKYQEALAKFKAQPVDPAATKKPVEPKKPQSPAEYQHSPAALYNGMIAPHQEMSPEIRDAQLFTWRTVPKTGMAVITDYGNPTNIHPKDKQPVGERLALAARAIAYGEKIEYSGPVFDKMKVNGKQAVLSFQHVGDGLIAKGEKLLGFEISSDGTAFVPADAAIVGETVVVTSDAVATPVAVRFGWANVPETNLFNKNGLPATPFRTDGK